MQPIHVPAPPKEAFNKHRRVSDLIRKQVYHFKHLEQKLPEHVRRELPQHPIVTEDDAARYIAPMTRLLLSQATEAARGPVAVPKESHHRKSEGISIAAAAESSKKKVGPKTTSKKRAGHSSKGNKR